MCTGRKTGHLTQVLLLHPLILGALANFAGLALHGGTATDRLRVLVQAVERAMHTARWRNGRRFLGSLCRSQSGRDIEGTLERTQLARLQRQLVQRRSGHARGGGRIVGGSVGGGVGWRGMTINGDLVGSRVGGHNTSRHDERCK